MGGRVHGTSHDGSNTEQCSRPDPARTLITRRRYLMVGTALTLVPGCLGDDDDQSEVEDDVTDDTTDDTTAVDETTPADDDDEEDTEAADDFDDDPDDDTDDTDDDTDDETEVALDVREDYESYILEMEVTHDGPDEEWTQRLYREADIENDRLYQKFEMLGDDGEQGTFEYYIVEGAAYHS